MDKRRELIEMLEKATGEDRDVDYRIERLLVRPEEFPDIAMWPPFSIGSTFEKSIPRYTASLDAAIALVEREGFEWLRKSPHSMTVYQPLTEEQDARKEWAVHHSAAGPTPAIALLLALLKAKDPTP